MKFSQKIVAASALLLFVTISLLSLQQQSTVRSEVESIVGSSLLEMIKGVRNTITADMKDKTGLAQSVTQIIELNLIISNMSKTFWKPLSSKVAILLPG